MRCASRFLIAVIGAVLLACSSIQVQTDWDPSADFADLHTWSFAPQPPKQPGPQVLADNPLVARRVRDALTQELAAKGYRKVDEGPADFLVGFFIVVQDKVSVTTIDDYYGYPHRRDWGYGATRTHIDTYQEGTLVVDVTQGSSDELIWRGSGSARLRPQSDPKAAEARIQQVVAKILEAFPPPPRD